MVDARFRVDFADGGKGASTSVADPPGFATLKELGDGEGGEPARTSAAAGKGAVAGPAKKRGHQLTPAMRVQKAYAFAGGQLQSILMMGFMMWMSGNGVQIFSIMITFGGIFNPAKAILTSGKTFERFGGADGAVDVTAPRLAFCAIQCVGLAMALYKLNAMGLLPTHASDWVSGMKPPRATERAYGGTTL